MKPGGEKGKVVLRQKQDEKSIVLEKINSSRPFFEKAIVLEKI